MGIMIGGFNNYHQVKMKILFIEIKIDKQIYSILNYFWDTLKVLKFLFKTVNHSDL